MRMKLWLAIYEDRHTGEQGTYVFEAPSYQEACELVEHLEPLSVLAIPPIPPGTNAS